MARKQRTVVPFRKPARRKVTLRAPGNRGSRPSGGLNFGRAMRAARPILLLIGLMAAYVLLTPSASVTPYDPASPDARLQGRFAGAEIVEGSFGLCDSGISRACVNDGDTFRIDWRKIRVVGIDTAEKDAKCPAEAAQAHASTLTLQQWLNSGYFIMLPQEGDAVDRYGRELLLIGRIGPNGRVERLADWMQSHGGARRYDGGQRSGWC